MTHRWLRMPARVTPFSRQVTVADRIHAVRDPDDRALRDQVCDRAAGKSESLEFPGTDDPEMAVSMLGQGPSTVNAEFVRCGRGYSALGVRHAGTMHAMAFRVA